MAAYMREWRKNNSERARAIDRNKRIKHRDLILQRKKKYREENKEKIYAYNRAYEKKNRHITRLMVANKRAKRRRAIPRWANMEKIRWFYKEAHRMTTSSGTVYHVDHIVPISGENVCGLHTHNNLQIITASENSSKKNLWVT